jgi:serine/threonine-protein kinase
MSTIYRLVGRIEEGELAELYKAAQQPGGDVVVKLFHPRTSDPAYARTLAETAGKLGTLRHPSIVQYLDIGFALERLAVVREYVDGFTLGTSLQRLHTKEVLLPSPIALFLVIQLLEAAQRAHEAGVIHGAITPGNVLLSRAGMPSLCEFGALNALMSVPTLKATFAGRGRSAYRAPEVGRGEPATEQSDIYSLAAIAYELLTLREPVVPGGGISTRREGLPPPSRLDRRINARLDPIIMRALDPSAQRRFRSCAEFGNALRNFLAASGGMPGTEELRRFASELFPNEVNLAVMGPVPSAEPFKLTPISGAEIAHLHAEEFENSVVARPTYSRPALTDEEANAETQEAPPMFEEFKPSERPTAAAPQYTPSDSQRPTAAATVQYTPPPADEATVARPTASSMEWDAPPGDAPPKPGGRRQPQVPLGGEGDSVSPSRRNPRLKVVEDYSAPLTQETQATSASRAPPSFVRPNPVAQAQADSQAAQAATRVGQPSPRLAPPPVASMAFRSDARESDEARNRPEVPMPPPTSEDIPRAGGKPRSATLMQRLRAIEDRRGRFVALAAAIAIVGVLSFLAAAWQFNTPAPADTQPQQPQAAVDPKATAVSGPLQEYLDKQKQQQQQPGKQQQPSTSPTPRAESTRPKATPETPAETAPAAAKDSAFLSLRTNVPAYVYIDGERVKRTPLTRYPVKPGSRTIAVEAVGTSEKRQFNLRFSKGQHRAMEETF